MSHLVSLHYRLRQLFCVKNKTLIFGEGIGLHLQVKNNVSPYLSPIGKNILNFLAIHVQRVIILRTGTNPVSETWRF